MKGNPDAAGMCRLPVSRKGIVALMVLPIQILTHSVSSHLQSQAAGCAAETRDARTIMTTAPCPPQPSVALGPLTRVLDRRAEGGRGGWRGGDRFIRTKFLVRRAALAPSACQSVGNTEQMLIRSSVFVWDQFGSVIEFSCRPVQIVLSDLIWPSLFRNDSGQYSPLPLLKSRVLWFAAPWERGPQ